MRISDWSSDGFSSDLGAEAVAREIRDNGGDAIALHVDLGDPNSIKKLIDDTLTHYGKLEVVFNNGAATQPELLNRDGMAGDMDIEVWDKTFDVNAGGTMLMIKHEIGRASCRERVRQYVEISVVDVA